MSYFARTLAAPSTLLTGLTSYWRMDEGSGTRVDVLGTNNLSAVNNPLSAAGKIGDAVSLVAASTQYLKCASNAGLQMGNNDRTLTYWLKLNSKPGVAQRVNFKGDSNAITSEYSLDYLTASDRFRFHGFQGAGAVTVVANNFGAVSTGVFMFIAVWHDSTSDLLGISVNNGTPNTTTITGGTNTSVFDFSIGCDIGNFYPVDGLIDASGIWGRVLTSTEITSLYNGGAGSPYPFIGMP